MNLICSSSFRTLFELEGTSKSLYVLFEKDQKVMSFLLAQKKELKKTSTYPQPLPIWRG